MHLKYKQKGMKMSKFAENSDLKPKNKFSEFVRLVVNARAARRAVRQTQKKVTVYVEKYHLDTSEIISGGSCINKFDKVVIDAPSTAQVDDSGYTVNCPLFSSTKFCPNRKCDWHAANMDYVSALDRYAMARAKRKNFVKNLFRSK